VGPRQRRGGQLGLPQLPGAEPIAPAELAQPGGEHRRPLDCIGRSAEAPAQLQVQRALTGADLQDLPAGPYAQAVKQRRGGGVPQAALGAQAGRLGPRVAKQVRIARFAFHAFLGSAAGGGCLALFGHATASLASRSRQAVSPLPQAPHAAAEKREPGRPGNRKRTSARDCTWQLGWRSRGSRTAGDTGGGHSGPPRCRRSLWQLSRRRSCSPAAARSWPWCQSARWCRRPGTGRRGCWRCRTSSARTASDPPPA